MVCSLRGLNHGSVVSAKFNHCTMQLPVSHQTKAGKYCLCMVSLSTLPTTLEGNQLSNIWFSNSSFKNVSLKLLNYRFKQVNIACGKSFLCSCKGYIEGNGLLKDFKGLKCTSYIMIIHIYPDCCISLIYTQNSVYM